MSIRSESRRVKHRILEQLSALRDEGKLQAHLLSLDARQRWDALEKQIQQLESEVEREGEKAADLLKQTAQELARSLNDFMAKHMNHAVGLLTSVRALMTSSVRTCDQEDSLAQAAQLMWNGDCGALPVVADAKVVAMITDRDVCMATFTQGKAPSELQVKGAMSKALFSCAPDDSVIAALSTMADQRVRRLPVVTEDARLVGIISIADVLRWAKPLANPGVDAALADTLGAISAFVPQKLDAAAE